jgi:hypothetical protein
MPFKELWSEILGETYGETCVLTVFVGNCEYKLPIQKLAGRRVCFCYRGWYTSSYIAIEGDISPSTAKIKLTWV